MDPESSHDSSKGGSLSPGDIVAERFEIRRRLERDDAWILYEADDRVLRTLVALKILAAEVSGETAERFQREIRMGRKLTHPCVRRVYEVGELHDGGGSRLFQTMEILDGPTLADMMAGGPLSLEGAIPLLRDVAEGLDAAHALRIVYRGLRPDGVFVMENLRGARRAVLGDLGRARLAGGMSSERGGALEAVLYSAPEQLAGGEVTPAVDLYALATIAWEMLTGDLPFGRDTASLTRRLAGDAPRPSRDLASALEPASVEALVRCLDPNPGRRLAKASDLVRALDSPGVLTTPPPSMSLVVPRPREGSRTTGAERKRPTRKVFLSYRRSDSAGFAGRLFDRLAERYGRDELFMDVAAIGVGEDFVETIGDAVASCAVVVVLMGPDWLRVTGADGGRRIDDPDDFVRLEILAGLELERPVIPVLAGGAAMPGFGDLPPALRGLARRNALELSPTRWDFDVARLFAAIEGQGVEPRHRLPRRRSWAVAALLAALLALGLFLWNRREGPEDPDPGSAPPVAEAEPVPASASAASLPMQLTTSRGRQVDPVFSPDGRSLAFASDGSGSFEIRLRSTELGGEEVLLTDDGLDNLQPAWSPDGTSLAYLSRGRGGIWSVSAEGGPPRRLTDFGSRPAWSPDGRSLLFQSDGAAHVASNSRSAMPPSVLWRLHLPDRRLEQLTTPGEPAGGHGAPDVSPDGSHVVFTASDRRFSHGWILDLATRELRPLSRSLGFVAHPRFGPEGRRILCAAGSRAGVLELWSVPWHDGTNAAPARLSSLGLASIQRLDLAPDGRRLVYSALSLESNLFLLAVDRATGLPTGEASREITAGTGRNTRPAFDPSGERIAFEGWQAGAQSDLWVFRRHDGSLRRVTVHPEEDGLPSWAPDGERLLFLSSRRGNGIWSISVAGGSPEASLSLPPEVGWVRLSPDGTRWAYHSPGPDGRISTYVMPSDGSQEALELISGEERAGFPSWSPDGSFLAIEVRRGDHDQIAVVPSNGGELEVLTSDDVDKWPFSWSPDGRRIAFAGRRNGQWNLYWVDRVTGEQQRLTDHEDRSVYVRYPAWSPRGEAIAYEKAWTRGNLWQIEFDPGS